MLLGTRSGRCITVGEMNGVRTHAPEQYRCSCREVINRCPFWTRVITALVSQGIDYAPHRSGTDIRNTNDCFIRTMLLPLHRGFYLEFIRDMALALYPRWHRHLREVQKRNVAIVRTLLSLSGASTVVDSSKNGLRLKYLLRNRDLDVKVIRLIRDGRGVALTWTDEATFADSRDPELRGGGFGRRRTTLDQKAHNRQLARGAHAWRCRRGGRVSAGAVALLALV